MQLKEEMQLKFEISQQEQWKKLKIKQQEQYWDDEKKEFIKEKLH